MMPEATVLIVDDDRTIVRLCQRLLEKASFHVYAMLDPLDALRILQQQKIDLLLSDIRMPVMDGFELITRAKQYQPGLPVLVMTGFGSVDTAIQALHRGVDGLILKPFENSSDLVEAVRRVLEESRQKRDAARLQVLRPLFDLSETLLAETSPQSLEKLIIDSAIRLFQARLAGIYRLGAEGSPAPLRMFQHDAYLTAESDPIRPLLHLAQPNGPVLSINAGELSQEEPQQLLRNLGCASLMIAAVQRNENQFIFYAGRDLSGQPFGESDLEMFAILARQSAVALENARLYTELKDYVRQVEESQRALIQAEKMAAVGRLMASLAHEINNPLQAVRNCLHLAARRDIDPDQRLSYLGMTDSELDRLVSTVRRMLDFSRPGRAEKEPLEIPALVERVLALLHPQLRGHNIQVNTQFTGQPQPFLGVRDQIQQVFFNLLINAMDAMENQPEAKQIWLDVWFEGKQIRLLIEDSGPGLPVDLQERIFEPFISTKRNGTGLGLAVSYGIIERHSGRMSIQTPRHKHGACIEVVLPLEEGG